MLICRYWGSDDAGAESELAGQRFVPSSARLDRLVAELNGLKRYPKSPLPSCPAFGGRSLVLLFRFQDRSDDPVRVVRAGCTRVENGKGEKLWASGLFSGEHWPDEGVV